MRTLIGMVTFGNLEFTKLSVEGIENTVRNPYDLFFIVGKPEDEKTKEYLLSKGYKFKAHDRNYGFPYSINDIYDYGWKENDYDYIIIIGNDVIPYPYAIDRLIFLANNSDYEWISSSELDVKTLVKIFPECKKYFEGANYICRDFSHRCWEKYKGYILPGSVVDNVIKDVHNLCLYKKSVFDTIGYVDVSFYPAYYEDNDYARRGVNANLKTCCITNSVFFHFWSRTIHQETGGSNNTFFENNRFYYVTKWGGDFGNERYSIPFDGRDFYLDGIKCESSLKIGNRDNEINLINYWIRRAGK